MTDSELDNGEKNRGLDVIDALVASCLAIGVVLWAFIWAHPYPHPNLWPFLATTGWHIPLTALAALGKVALGVFAGLVYLVLRGAWIRFREEEDELPDRFFFTRFCPLCGAVVFALLPPAWRSAQFLSPDFALLVLATLAIVCWQHGCGYRHLTLSSAAYLLLTFVAGVNPLGLVALAYVSVCDILRRWQSAQTHAQQEDDALVQRRCSIEKTLSFAAGSTGFVASVYLASIYFAGGVAPDGLVEAVMGWWRGWFAAGLALFGAFNVLVLICGIGLAAIALALGRRLRAFGPPTFALSVTLSSALAAVALLFALRAVDADARVRLALIRDYVRAVLADSEGATWLFTDGRFDDALRFEVQRRGLNVRVLNALTPPTKAVSARLRDLAPEPGDAEIFAAGGAEVFKAWARERPDRLAASAWQLGSPVVRRFGKVHPCTYGTVMRADTAIEKAKGAEADGRFVELTHEVRRVLEHPAPGGVLFGTADDVVTKRFDSLIWRAARMAGERSESASKGGNTNAAEAERVTMQTLDGLNGTLRAQGHVLEQLLPTMNLVLTPKEALNVSLKRADFALAQRYACEVLVSSPNDSQALFALGMLNLQTGDFFKASRYLERVLKVHPNEPATLNNLSLAYMKLGKLEEAQQTAEKALKVNPNSAEIKKNLAAIQKALKKE